MENHAEEGFDVIIVLGAMVRKGGEPSGALKRRVEHGVNLYWQKRAVNIIMSGGIGAHPPAEAEVMRDMALERGVPGAAITVESWSSSTLQNALECASIMKKRGWRSAVIVTDSYHAARAILSFQSLGVKVKVSPPHGAKQVNPFWKWCFLHFREGIAIVFYFFVIPIKKLIGFFRDGRSSSGNWNFFFFYDMNAHSDCSVL